MSKKHNLIHQYKINLQNQTRYGQSKHKDKILAKEECKKAKTTYQQPKGIYSTSTYHSYDDICNSFLLWVLENHKEEIKTYEDCKQFATEWLTEKEQQGLSAWSLHLYGSALACSFGGLSKSELGYQFPARERKNIIRNRNDDLSRGFSSKKKEQAYTMLKATGCRRSEMLRLRKEDFRAQKDSNGAFTGNIEVFKRGKGGIERWCLVNPNYTQFVKEFLREAPTYLFAKEERLFQKRDIPPDGVHSTRAIYAQDLYHYYETHGGQTGELYHCRKELAGTAYDKGVLQKVSHDLQHSRNNIVVQYLWITR